MIKVTQVDFGYKRSHLLFKSIGLDLPAGSIVGLLGRNGEGKSTLMKLISGVLRPRSGSIEVLGYKAAERPVKLLQQIYLLPEDLSLPSMTIREYFSVYAPFYPSYDASIGEELVKEFNLQWDMKLDKISLGQRKKAAIALALSLRTPLLLMDEPTNGLDIPSKSVFRRMLARYSSPEQSIIISTHQVRDLEQLIDRILLLDGNQITCNESIATLGACFGFGIVEPSMSQPILYREPAVMGEYAVYGLDGEEEEATTFSMELFFNAMVGQRELMQGHLAKYKMSHPNA
ncbi:ATP-binding cassette domain-containing protein [Porphyromonas sp. COT-290 OH3588]|uniref:ABC transporter ATP-binding protein n=1 Tax=Porphyromonas sp. COT-290 OH3588 TaxID=1515617 RepID=UPI00052BB57F|nr:ABC transporter ATP-binding protein [Porphyromonas sp. COT-290 OH3588]KGO01663.1 ABC transporter ATP-binding protein [Porphyromonas sp. COT-290 OH3588]